MAELQRQALVDGCGRGSRQEGHFEQHQLVCSDALLLCEGNQALGRFGGILSVRAPVIALNAKGLSRFVRIRQVSGLVGVPACSERCARWPSAKVLFNWG